MVCWNAGPGMIRGECWSMSRSRSPTARSLSATCRCWLISRGCTARLAATRQPRRSGGCSRVSRRAGHAHHDPAGPCPGAGPGVAGPRRTDRCWQRTGGRHGTLERRPVPRLTGRCTSAGKCKYPVDRGAGPRSEAAGDQSRVRGLSTYPAAGYGRRRGPSDRNLPQERTHRQTMSQELLSAGSLWVGEGRW